MELSFVVMIIWLSFLGPNDIAASKILMSCPQILSHVMVQAQVASELISRGHEVYMAIGSRMTNPKKLEKIGIKIIYYHIPEDVTFGLTDEFDAMIAQSGFTQGFPEYPASLLISRDCSLMMHDESFKQKIKDIKFDLAIIGAFVYGPCNLILGQYLKIPFISMATMLLPWELRIPAMPSFNRVIGWYPIVDGDTFTGRVRNLLYYIFAETSIYVPGPRNTTLLQQYAPEVQSWKELVRKSELILTDIDHHMGLPLPAFPYLVTVPGISVRPAKPLEPSMETLVTENKNGIIVMSFGSMVHHIPGDVIRKFLEAFSRLKQTVIARIEPPTDGTIVPKNVKLFSWLSQNDLLGHGNTRIFITHCGNSGQHEMLYHGVPFVGFPMFSDQDVNCHIASERGYGLKLNILKFTSEELFDAIEEVLNNENYTRAIKRASEIFRDEPLNGRQKAVHWIDHVIKYGGSHLRSKALDLPLYQFLMLDIVGMLVILGLISLWLIRFITTVAVRKICSTKPKPTMKGFVPQDRNVPEKLKFS